MKRSDPILLFDRDILEAGINVAIDNPDLIPRLIKANGRSLDDCGQHRAYAAILDELADLNTKGERPDRDVLISRMAERSGLGKKDCTETIASLKGRGSQAAFPLFEQRLAELRIRRDIAALGERAQNGSRFADLMVEAQRIATATTAPTGNLFEDIDVLAALREGVPPVRYDLRPYLAAGTLTLISGPPKSAKTWIALNWSVSLATGRSFCGLAPEGEHRILFVEAEYPRQIIIRVGELCRALQVNPEQALERIKFIRPRRRLQLEDPAQAAALLEAAQNFRATLVVIDSLRRVHGLDENNSRDMANLADGALLPLRGNEERSVLVIDHDAKAWQMGNRPKSQQLRGSGDKLASADVLLHVEKHEPEDEPRRYELTIAASRIADEDVESLWLQIHATRNGGVLVDVGEPLVNERKGRKGRKPAQYEIALNVIRAEQGRNPSLTWKEAVAFVMKAGPSRRTALNAWNECKGHAVQEVQE